MLQPRSWPRHPSRPPLLQTPWPSCRPSHHRLRRLFLSWVLTWPRMVSSRCYTAVEGGICRFYTFDVVHGHWYWQRDLDHNAMTTDKCLLQGLEWIGSPENS